MNAKQVTPKFLPNDEVFAVPESSRPWIDSFGCIGTYRISRVAIVPKHVGSEETEFEYYATLALACYIEVQLKHVFATKEEFLKFIADREFEYQSPLK